MDWTNDRSKAALVEIACNFVPYGRPAKPREEAALRRFLEAHGIGFERAVQLLRAGLTGRRPKPTLNSRLSFLCKTLTEAERHDFMHQVTRLMFDIDGADERLQAFTHFTGVFLGLREGDLALIREVAARQPSPRVE